MRLKGADPVLGVEMASTGEVACFGATKQEAFLKVNSTIYNHHYTQFTVYCPLYLWNYTVQSTVLLAAGSSLLNDSALLLLRSLILAIWPRLLTPRLFVLVALYCVV
jgi:hypothetical protein